MVDCLIRDHYHEEVDLAHLPPDQPDVYDTIRKADTVGMFQIESRAQMLSLPRNSPRPILRSRYPGRAHCPGPIVGEMTTPISGAGRAKTGDLSPSSLVPVLERTLGVPLFSRAITKWP